MGDALNAGHRSELKASGLSDEVIAASGICSVTSAQAGEFLGFDPKCGGWAVAYPGTEGEDGRPFRRLKPDVARSVGAGKPAKYLSPKKGVHSGGNRLYVPPNLAAAALRDPSVPLCITEGEKKALKACQDGIPTVGLSGVFCFVTKDGDGNSGPMEDLDLITWTGRKVRILFDSDVVLKDSVQLAEYRLYLELRSRGAKCTAGRLPEPTVEEDERYKLGGKFGLDDFLVVRGAEDLQGIIRGARAPRKPKPPADDDPPRHYDVAREFLRDRDCMRGDDLALRWWRSSFWRWTGRCYEEWPDADVGAGVMRYIQSRSDLQARATKHFVANVIANLQGICALDASVDPPIHIGSLDGHDPSHWIALENAVLDVNAVMSGSGDVLRPHSPRFFTMNALPFAFDQDAECPLWESVLRRVLPDKQAQELLQEWFGYCLLPEVWLQKFIVMLGEGANGKSVILKVLENLLGGERNVSAVPIERFRDTHSLVGTLGKLVNVSAEFEEIDKRTEGTLKAFVSGDPMEFNQKYRPTFTARPTARLITAANKLPTIRDKSLGLFRRMVVLDFSVTIPESEQDPLLVEKLSRELPGILNWALVGLFRVLRREQLVEPARSVELRAEHRLSCNPARMFLEENLRYVPNTSVGKQTVYDAFKLFCAERGFSPLNEANFAAEVYRFFGTRVTRSRERTPAGRVQVYRGLAWSDGAHGNDGQGGQGEIEKSLKDTGNMEV